MKTKITIHYISPNGGMGDFKSFVLEHYLIEIGSNTIRITEKDSEFERVMFIGNTSNFAVSTDEVKG